MKPISFSLYFISINSWQIRILLKHLCNKFLPYFQCLTLRPRYQYYVPAITNKPRHHNRKNKEAKRLLNVSANSEKSDQSVHPCSLAVAFILCLLILQDSYIIWANSKDSDQPMRRLILAFAVRIWQHHFAASQISKTMKVIYSLFMQTEKGIWHMKRAKPKTILRLLEIRSMAFKSLWVWLIHWAYCRVYDLLAQLWNCSGYEYRLWADASRHGSVFPGNQNWK